MGAGSITIDLSFGTLFGIAVLVGAVALIIFARVGWRRLVSMFRGRQFNPTNREGMRRRWAEIEQLLEGQGELQRKVAIMEADKLLDHALKALAMPGETLGERLKFAAYKYPKIGEVWWAHKIRNQLAHEATYHLDAAIARRAIKEFRRALEMLGAL